MVDGPTQVHSLPSAYRSRLSPLASHLLGELADNPLWREILDKLEDVRIRPWTPGQADVSQWAYDSGTVDGVRTAVAILRGSPTQE